MPTGRAAGFTSPPIHPGEALAVVGVPVIQVRPNPISGSDAHTLHRRGGQRIPELRVQSVGLVDDPVTPCDQVAPPGLSIRPATECTP